jgi:hypothetical protein
VRRLLRVLSAALRCGYHGACMAFAWPDLHLHVVASNLSATGLRALLDAGTRGGMADLERDVQTTAGEQLIERELGR